VRPSCGIRDRPLDRIEEIVLGERLSEKRLVRALGCLQDRQFDVRRDEDNGHTPAFSRSFSSRPLMPGSAMSKIAQ
jgi:hypothetical protein